MKKSKFIRSLGILLVVILITTSISAKCVNAKSIYFSGEYIGKNSFSYEEKSEAILQMNQYSSPDNEKEVGNFSIISYGGKVRPQGTLIKIGKNKYKCKKSDMDVVLIFNVKKKKVIVKQKGKIKTSRGYLSYAGTYKLNKRFYS